MSSHRRKNRLPGLLLALPALLPVQAATLDLQLSNLRPGGAVEVEIHADADSWEHGGAPQSQQRFVAREPRQQLRFAGLPPGRYAVRVRQHANPGGWLGREPPSFAVPRLGYSRRPLAGPVAPRFEGAALQLDDAGAMLPIRLRAVAD